MGTEYIERWAAAELRQILSFQRAAVVVGARQCGKTTLVKNELADRLVYLSLDDPAYSRMAHDDPVFLTRQGGQSCLVIDEIQKAPELIGLIKMRVDEDPRPCQFVLTGSADYRRLPFVSDSLAGRASFVRLRGLAEAESRGARPDFLERAFERNFPALPELEACSKRDALDLAIRGGYPAVRTLNEPSRKRYFRSYVEAQIKHDLARHWNMERLDALETLIRYAAVYSSKPLNLSEISKRVQASRGTVSGYLKALQAMYLVDELPAWLHNEYDIGSKVPKLFMADTGLMAYLLRKPNADAVLASALDAPDVCGKLVETWIYNQIAPEVDLHPGWQMTHFRNGNRQEIDFLIEDDAGRMLGIEVKSSETVSKDDARHLLWFAQRSPKPFTGIVLHCGRQVLSFGEGCYALPYSALWSVS
jgi:hypothetical protein